MNDNDIIHAVDGNSVPDECFGEITTDGFFAKHVAEQMKKSDESITDAAINDVFSNATSILNQCPNPTLSGEFKKTGIVIK